MVLPLVPVTARTSAVIARYASSTSPITGTPRRRQSASAGCSAGTPGLVTHSSASANASGGCPPAWSRTPSAASARAASPRSAAGLASVAVTRAPHARSSRHAATPLRARPTTVTRRPASAARNSAPRAAIDLSSSTAVISA